jgi:signal transduction histidine kinase
VSAFPISHAGEVRAALVMRESLASRDAYIKTSIRNTALTTLALAGLCSLLTLFLGISLVGRPVRALAEQARRIGQGELGYRVSIRKRDEIGELAEEMNAMCERLEQSQKRLEQESRARIRALEQLRHADRLTTLGKLASGVAHELGTPLNVVLGRAKMIRTRELNREATSENARIISEQAERMTAIIRELLDFARARGPKKTRVDLGSLASRTARLLAPLAAKRDVTIEVDATRELPSLEVDPSQIQQVLTNLVLNAAQVSPADSGIRVEVGLEARSPPADVGGDSSDVLTISVADRGTGIDAAVLPHVFEPFFTTKEPGEGTGLGLSVAYGIVREHGGWIDVETTLGHGSRFVVCLPIGVGQ